MLFRSILTADMQNWKISEVCFGLASPPQRIDEFIELVRDGLHLEVLRRVVIDRQAEAGDAVAVAARGGDGGIELALQAGDLRGLAVNERLERGELCVNKGQKRLIIRARCSGNTRSRIGWWL